MGIHHLGIFGVHPIDSDGWPETRWTWGPRILMRNVTFLVWLRRNLGSLGTIGLESVHGPNFRFQVTHFWATHILASDFRCLCFFCHDRENFLLRDTCSNMRFYLWGGKSFVEHLTSCVGILEFSTFTMFFLRCSLPFTLTQKCPSILMAFLKNRLKVSFDSRKRVLCHFQFCDLIDGYFFQFF